MREKAEITENGKNKDIFQGVFRQYSIIVEKWNFQIQ